MEDNIMRRLHLFDFFQDIIDRGCAGYRQEERLSNQAGEVCINKTEANTVEGHDFEGHVNCRYLECPTVRWYFL